MEDAHYARRTARTSLGPDAARTALATGGLLAAFGVAACCALPIVLSVAGIGAASLVSVGFLAAPYQTELFYLAAVCLAAAVFVTWRQRRLQSCAVGGACAHPWAGWLTWTAIGFGVALLALTFWYAPPI
jgi:mercuric ion transport protein